MKSTNTFLFLAVSALAIGVAGCTPDSTGAASPASAVEQVVAVAPSWNMSDPDAATSGNIEVGIKALLKGLEEPKEKISDADVFKRPWDFYGKNICFSGSAMIVQDYPPGNPLSELLGDSISEVVFATEEGTIVDGFLKGTSGNAKVGAPVTVCGTPVGRITVDNQLGGKTTQLAVVGLLK